MIPLGLLFRLCPLCHCDTVIATDDDYGKRSHKGVG